MTTASVKEDQLGFILPFPKSKLQEMGLREIRQQDRETVIDYFIKYSPYASWTWIAGQLYHLEKHEALSAVKKFIKGTRGKCVYNISLM